MLHLIFTANIGGTLVPHRYSDGMYRTVDPAAGAAEANSDDVLFDHLRRGYRVWISREDQKPVLVDPRMIMVQFR